MIALRTHKLMIISHEINLKYVLHSFFFFLRKVKPYPKVEISLVSIVSPLYYHIWHSSFLFGGVPGFHKYPLPLRPGMSWQSKQKFTPHPLCLQFSGAHHRSQKTVRQSQSLVRLTHTHAVGIAVSRTVSISYWPEAKLKKKSAWVRTALDR